MLWKIIGITVGILFAYVAFKIAKSRARNPWLWAVLTWIACLPVFPILLQLPKNGTLAKYPSWQNWLGRILLVIILIPFMLHLGDTPIPALANFDYHVICKIAGITTEPAHKGVPSVLSHSLAYPFAVASFGLIFGMLIMRKQPYATALLILIGFGLGWLARIFGYALVLYIGSTSHTDSSIWNLPKFFFAGGLFLLLFISWALAYDWRYKTPA